jgi:hypothetical protein
MLSGKSCSKEYLRKGSEAPLAWFQFPQKHLKISENMLSGISCCWEKSRANGHLDRRHFLKVLYENDLKIKNKPDQEYCKLRIASIQRNNPQSRETTPLNKYTMYLIEKNRLNMDCKIKIVCSFQVC